MRILVYLKRIFGLTLGTAVLYSRVKGATTTWTGQANDNGTNRGGLPRLPGAATQIATRRWYDPAFRVRAAAQGMRFPRVGGRVYVIHETIVPALERAAKRGVVL